MPLDPFLAPLVASLPPAPAEIDDFPAWREQELAGAEALASQLLEPAPEVLSARTVTLPVAGGEITLNVFHPLTAGPHGVHLYFHGGGWIGGTIHSRMVDILCRERAVGADCIVVAVDYRKAPEHPFPAALEDGYAALLWVAENIDELGGRADGITVGGGSAGANLAAGLALKARDENGPAIAFQLLEVPSLDFTFSSPSIRRFATGYGLTEKTLHLCRRLYLTDPADATNPYASPLLADDLTGLPPAYIMSSEYDLIVDDGERYAERLRAAGVPATFSLQLGHIHGSSAFTAVMESARDWRQETFDVLRVAHSTPVAG
ncbi:alpha/beta hydrolase [Rathayibacter caricis DSM 15933]|uniref:Alpha/beta hydrolase n=1 Tax=Rathayibacter caricis DSM 15933 TaxID=1328867 RepID=A0A2T4USE5_9MICO|nr:alpha/beta hydrolase [Rathayibacter caricis]PTL72445.1 alpha/beta hydrolase [Rathayibacter caricis DSM 15933]